MRTSGNPIIRGPFTRWPFTRWPFTRWMRCVTLLALLGALALPLASCGKKAPLDPPPGGEDSPYPRPYPTR